MLRESMRSQALFLLVLTFWNVLPLAAQEPDLAVDLWPGPIAGEQSFDLGHQLPQRPNETPPATRIESITRPQLLIYRPKERQGPTPAVLIFPGGGYNYVVVDKEGIEVAQWLNSLGIAGIVVKYRTKDGNQQRPVWARPLEDGQRAVSLVRARADVLSINPDQIGVMGFSAGGNAAALVSTRFPKRSYPVWDEIDQASCRPDFSMLIYPAYLVEKDSVQLVEHVTVTKETPPAFLVHAHDDSVTSLSSIAYYTALKQNKIPAELHIYAAGGHGYGLRPVEGSDVASWPKRAEDWLTRQGLVKK